MLNLTNQIYIMNVALYFIIAYSSGRRVRVYMIVVFEPLAAAELVFKCLDYS